jgi:hypothetical protein
VARNILALADRLHKTPDEIREGFTWEDYIYFMAYLRILDAERRADG